MKKKAVATRDDLVLGERKLRLEYNFLAYSIMREACGVSPLDGVDFDKLTEPQFVGFLAAGLQTHQPDMEVEWLAKHLNLDNFGDVMAKAVDAYIASMPKRTTKDIAPNPPKPVS